MDVRLFFAYLHLSSCVAISGAKRLNENNTVESRNADKGSGGCPSWTECHLGSAASFDEAQSQQ